MDKGPQGQGLGGGGVGGDVFSYRCVKLSSVLVQQVSVARQAPSLQLVVVQQRRSQPLNSSVKGAESAVQPAKRQLWGSAGTEVLTAGRRGALPRAAAWREVSATEGGGLGRYWLQGNGGCQKKIYVEQVHLYHLSTGQPCGKFAG